MPRILCLLLGIVLASLPLVDATIQPNEPSPSDLILARGGDPAQGKGSNRCDYESGAYVGCTKVGDPCKQCLTVDENGSFSANMADTLDSTAPKGATGYMRGQNAQDCGNQFDGNCVASTTSSTGFNCVGTDSMNSCTQGIQQIIPQTGLGGGDWLGGPR